MRCSSFSTHPVTQVHEMRKFRAKSPPSRVLSSVFLKHRGGCFLNYRASTMADARYWKKIQSRALSLSPDAEHGEAKAKVSNPYKFGDLHAEPRIGIRVPEGSGAICKTASSRSCWHVGWEEDPGQGYKLYNQGQNCLMIFRYLIHNDFFPLYVPRFINQQL